jgi:hypothetical protein
LDTFCCVELAESVLGASVTHAPDASAPHRTNIELQINLR